MLDTILINKYIKIEFRTKPIWVNLYVSYYTHFDLTPKGLVYFLYCLSNNQ